jgi:sulfur-carrier protein
MPVTVRIPTQLRSLSGGASEVAFEGDTVAAALAALDAAHPGFGERLHDDTGNLRRFVNVFVADEDIRFLDGVGTALKDGSVVSIVPAVAGG